MLPFKEVQNAPEEGRKSLFSPRFEALADITLIGMREDGRDIENFGQKFIGVDAGGHLQAEYFFPE